MKNILIIATIALATGCTATNEATIQPAKNSKYVPRATAPIRTPNAFLNGISGSQAFDMGTRYHQQRNYDKAIFSFKHAAENGYTPVRSYLHLANVHFGIKNYYEAQVAAKNVLSIEPNNKSAHDMLKRVDKVFADK
jgi:tetratricopeptide (TPR) repeat protein